MRKEIPVARVGDVCILVEPAEGEHGWLRKLQKSLQRRYGGRLHQRPHFTCQRFSPTDDEHLVAIFRGLQARLAATPPLMVMASELVLAQHPFWEFSVLRWDLQLTARFHHFAEIVDEVLNAEGLAGHYPLGEEWNPHVTALERIYQNGHRPGIQSPACQFLYPGVQVVLSQVRPGKQFEIVGKIPLEGSQVGAGPIAYSPRFGRATGS